MSKVFLDGRPAGGGTDREKLRWSGRHPWTLCLPPPAYGHFFCWRNYLFLSIPDSLI